MKRFTLAVAIAAAMITILAPAANAASSFRYDNNLRWWVHNTLEASTMEFGRAKVVPKPVEVRCYSDREAFELRLLNMGASWTETRTTVAYYQHGSNTIHVRDGTCRRAQEFTEGHVTELSAGAFATILHEAVHRQGIRSENLTEEMALIAMFAAGRLVDFQWRPSSDMAAWEKTDTQGVHALGLAWNQHQRWIASEYRVPFKTLKADFTQMNWSDFVSG